MGDDGQFVRWFNPWKAARPDMAPIGWYVLADLEAAFNAGITAEREQVIVAALGPERAEELLRVLRGKD